MELILAHIAGRFTWPIAEKRRRSVSAQRQAFYGEPAFPVGAAVATASLVVGSEISISTVGTDAVISTASVCTATATLLITRGAYTADAVFAAALLFRTCAPASLAHAT